MLKVILYNFIPKFNFNFNLYKYCNLVIDQLIVIYDILLLLLLLHFPFIY